MKRRVGAAIDIRRLLFKSPGNVCDNNTGVHAANRFEDLFKRKDRLINDGVFHVLGHFQSAGTGL
jgi:hypothetical protein